MENEVLLLSPSNNLLPALKMKKARSAIVGAVMHVYAKYQAVLEKNI